MKTRLQNNWKTYLVYGLIGLWAIAFYAIFSASAKAGCSDNQGLLEAEGICRTRGLAGLSCFAGFIGVWVYLGGLMAMAKGRSPWIGWILGLTLEFLGCFLIWTWEPRRDRGGRLIGWDEYKHYSKAQKDAIRPVKEPISRNRMILIAVVIGFTVLVLILTVLNNLGMI